MQTRFELDTEERFAPEVEEALYRVALEAMNNVLRHSYAGRVSVSLCQEDGRVLLEVVDDGIGFDTDAVRAQGGGLGLRGMEERVTRLGGTLTLISAPDAGTRVRVEVDL
jgi:signal transduction histidine kinase